MAVQTLANIDGMLKPVFGALQDLIPSETPLQDMFPFSTSDQVGNYFQEPVMVRPCWGLTFLGTTGSGAASDFALNAALPNITASAQVTPSLVVLRSQVGYAQLDRGQGGEKSFKNVAAFTGLELTKQLRRVLEVNMLCGQSGLMTVESWDDTGTGGTITVSAASLRPGLLSLLEGCIIDTLDPSTLVPRTNSVGLTIDAVDVDARTIHISNEPTNDPQAGDIISFFGAIASTSSAQEMCGLKKQISLQTGTIFNINKATYSQNRGNVGTSFGPMTSGNLLALVAKCANRGLTGRAVAIMSTKAWASLNDRAIAQQVFDSSYKPSKAQEGTDKIEIRAGNGVVVEVVGHSFGADGEVMVVPKDYVKRVGSGYSGADGTGGKDISFEVPGASGFKYILPINGSAAVEFQVRSDQAIYLQRCNQAAYASGVTY